MQRENINLAQFSKANWMTAFLSESIIFIFHFYEGRGREIIKRLPSVRPFVHHVFA